MIRCLMIVLSSLLLLFPLSAYALQVFPGAEGYGADWSIQDWPDTTPDVYRIDTLSYTRAVSDPLEVDDHGTWKEYKSSLFYALQTATGARVIIFEVSGYIDWCSEGSNSGVRIDNPYVIVAGQTAPSPGITIKNAPLTTRTHDVLIQHLRARSGDENGCTCCEHYSSCNTMGVEDIPVENDVYNVVLDHLSLSWSVDKLYQNYNAVYDVTLSNSLLCEPLKTDESPYGNCDADERHTNNMMLLSGSTPSPVSVIKCFMSGGKQRSPYFDDTGGSCQAIFVNNVVYDWGNIAANAHADDNQEIDMEGNVYIKGPNTTQSSLLRLYDAADDSSYWLSDNSMSAKPPISRSVPAATQWDLVGGTGKGDGVKAAGRNHVFPTLTVLANSATEAYVRNNAGAYMAYRGDIAGDIDSEMWGHIDAGTGDWHTTHPTYPTLTPDTRALSLPANPHDDSGDGYSNLEKWLFIYAGYVQETTSVTVTATDATATEESTTTGEWTISCSPDCIGQTINYSFSGGATLDTGSGGDYNCDDEDGTITITGASDTITLTPNDDGDVEVPEGAVLTIDTGTGYTPGSPSSAEIVIEDNDDPSPPTGGADITMSGGSLTIDMTGGSLTITISPSP